MVARLTLAVRSQLLFALMRLRHWVPHAFGFGVREVEGEEVSRSLRWFLRLVQADPVKSTPQNRRAVYERISDSYLGGPVADVEVLDTQTEGRAPIPIRIYRPKKRGDVLPCIMWVHGGGYVIGSLRTHDRFCRALCEYSDAVVIALDYRLAPEHPYPAAHEDVTDVYHCIRRNASKWGIDAARLAIGGDSAGGGLTAALCQRLPEEERPHLQILCYPGTDLSKAWPSYIDWADGYFLTRALMRWFLDHYCPKERRSEPQASPLLADSLDGQPDTLLITAGMDPLLDEGRAYGDKLERAGVKVNRLHIGPMVHGFITLRGVLPLAEQGVRDIAERASRLLRS